jgi:hypothetical protein
MIWDSGKDLGYLPEGKQSPITFHDQTLSPKTVTDCFATIPYMFPIVLGIRVFHGQTLTNVMNLKGMRMRHCQRLRLTQVALEPIPSPLLGW